jgi:PIN domain nuclease of toxin-antitoxin system
MASTVEKSYSCWQQQGEPRLSKVQAIVLHKESFPGINIASIWEIQSQQDLLP